MTIYSMAVTLYLIMDSIGNVPLFLSLLKHVEPKRRKWVLMRESIFAFFILLIFLYGGKSILDALQVSQQALGIAGGIILFLIAIKLIFPPDKSSDEPVGEPFIVPMAIPLIAGPSSIAFVTLLASQHPHADLPLFLAVFAASAASMLTLLLSEPLRKILGERGLVALERLTGMMLTTIAVQMLLTGITHYLHMTPTQ